MSRVFRIERQRWAAKEMVLARWLVAPATRVDTGQPVCVLRTDGVERELMKPNDGDFWGVYQHLVAEGEEVPPGGTLLEFSDVSVPREPRGGGPPRRAPLRRREKYPPVFLSYRRADSDAYAGRLHEALCTALGDADSVFVDQFSIRPGEPFAWAIQQAAAHCSVMVALIGPQWLTVADNYGRPKLASPSDYLRREITAALDRGIDVIPVLLPGGEIPDVQALPDEMRGLEERQMLPLTARHWRADFDDLFGSVRAAIAR